MRRFSRTRPQRSSHISSREHKWSSVLGSVWKAHSRPLASSPGAVPLVKDAWAYLYAPPRRGHARTRCAGHGPALASAPTARRPPPTVTRATDTLRSELGWRARGGGGGGAVTPLATDAARVVAEARVQAQCHEFCRLCIDARGWAPSLVVLLLKEGLLCGRLWRGGA